MQKEMSNCKKKLALLWFVGAGIIFIIFIIQTIFGKYCGYENEAWGWVLSAIMPTLSLMIGVFAIDVMNKDLKRQTVDSFTFRLTYSLAVAYFVVILMLISLQPFSNRLPIELMNLSTVFLGPFQGLIAGAMGIFFTKSVK